MQKKRRQILLEKLKLTNPQKENVLQLLASQKNKYRKLLHEAHERMHIIADLTSSLEFWLNVDGRFEHISPMCATVTGYTPQEFLDGGITMDQVIHPDSRRQFLIDRRRAMLGKSGSDVEYKFLNKDGAQRWALASWHPVYTRRGKQIGVRISISDITRLKETQAEAHSYRDAIERYASSRNDTAVFSVNSSLGVIRWPEAAARLFGYEESTALSLTLPDLLDGRIIPGGLFNGTLPDVPVPATCARADGSGFAAAIMAHPQRDADGMLRCWCVFITAEMSKRA